jgi:trehalose synthase
MRLTDVDVQPLETARLNSVIGAARADKFERTAAVARSLLDGRQVLNVNSTATGGGVAELLQTLLAYARGAGIDARWVVIRGNPAFFEITKRVHNHLYGTPGDHGPLGDTERARYEATLRENVDGLLETARAGDYLLLHDPQTAGLAAAARRAGAKVVWRCHVGIDGENEYSRTGWDFLRPYLEDLDAYVFSCPQFAPAWIPPERLFIIPPSIDPFSTKNEQISEVDTEAILSYVGLLDGAVLAPTFVFTRRDRTQGRVQRRITLVAGTPVPPGAPLVLQASRWDSLKDMPGVMTAFADHLATTDAHLVLAGPECVGVADDPEADAVLQDCVSTWKRFAREIRDRICLACVPMDDPDEAATMVNALQRRADVVVQKSLAEGFGLTVAEAMWKAKPVVGSKVGGITDQIVDGETGFLVTGARDLESFASLLQRLLDDPATAKRVGVNAHEHAREHFLGDRHLEQWAKLFLTVDNADRDALS